MLLGLLMKDKKNIVIYAGKFGLEFSGGCIATCKLMEAVQDEFNAVIVVANEIGNHYIKNLQHIPCSSIEFAIPILKSFDPNQHIFYGDFFDSIALVKADVPFYFTYHDNWPEQKELSQQDEINALYFISTYEEIFKKAKKVFSVSEYKLKFIHQFTTNTTLLRNGILQQGEKKVRKIKSNLCRILMTGNIDARKYEKAISVFHLLEKENHNIQIDIFGWNNDVNLAQQLNAFSFVKLKGYQKDISYAKYDAYLSTSFIENLSISVVEALQHHLPVICFDVGGLKEVVNQNNGYIIPPFRFEEMSKSILEIHSKNYTFNSLPEFNWEEAGKTFLRAILN